MKATHFTAITRELDIYQPGIGPSAVDELQQLASDPVPVLPLEHRSQRPSRLMHLGKLIRSGLAERAPDAKHFIATEQGREWLGKLKKHHLITL